MAADSLNLDLLAAHPWVRRIEFHEELDSTNNRALALAATGTQPLPLLILAERQTAGRGRGENRWWAASGSLTFSLLVEASRATIPPQRRPLVSLMMALAVGDALRQHARDADVALKWPNDVFLRGRKVCGILVETSGAQPGHMIVGVGVNVNNSFVEAPPELAPLATSLTDVTGAVQDRTALLADLLTRFAENWQQLSTGNLDLVERWRPQCYLTGRTVHLRAGERVTVGRCQGIDDDGALVLLTENGRERCLAGVVAKIE